MLVLTQKPGDRVRLRLPDGRDIWVTLLEVHRGKLRLGFDAPRDVDIRRGELLQGGPPPE